MRARVLLIVGSILAGLAVAYAFGGTAAFARIAQLPAWPFAAGLAMIVLGWLVNAERLRLLARGLGPRLTRRETIQLVMATEFSYAATPAGAGGPLTAIYLLTRHGIPAARAAALCTVDQLLDLVFFLTLLPLLAALLLGGYAPIQLQYQLLLLALMLVGGLVLAALALWKYRRALLFTGRILRALRIRRVRRVRLARAFVRFRHGIRLILALPRRRLLAVYALCAAHWLLRYSVLFVLIKGAGADVAWSTLILVQMLALTAGQLSLLPGGSGTVELVFGAMMSRWLDPATAVAVMLEWRFVLYYWYLLAGAPFFVAQILRRRKQTVLELTRTA
ncbi:MAG: flippase-like domain-containing protein [Gammaproteobacteria bacterium]|nr:flippase-like domain-containing protein [Gammaproteobacteria bacterium]